MTNQRYTPAAFVVSNELEDEMTARVKSDEEETEAAAATAAVVDPKTVPS